MCASFADMLMTMHYCIVMSIKHLDHEGLSEFSEIEVIFHFKYYLSKLPRSILLGAAFLKGKNIF